MSTQQNEESRKVSVGNVTGVSNEGEATFTYKDNAAIHVSASMTSTDQRPDCYAECSQNNSGQASQYQSNRATPVAAGIAIHGGSVNIQHPNLNVGASVSETGENRLKRILKTINANTWEKTHVAIGETFKADKFPESVPDVHPQMTESPRFYQGGHFIEDDINISVVQVFKKKSRNRKPKKKRVDVRRPQYRKDAKFAFHDTSRSVLRSISTESLLKKIYEKKEKFGILGVVAQAGAGKTTCMRRWARNAMKESGLNTGNGFETSASSRFQLVHFMEMKSIEDSQSTSLSDVLFGDLFENQEDAKQAYNYLLQNQDKAVVFFDGLDQARWTITEDDVKTVGRYKTASTATIFANLLTRDLLPGVRIVVSSREHSATSLPEETWFKDVITLRGFSEENAKGLFNIMTSEDNTDRIDRFATDSSLRANEEEPTSWDMLVETSSALIPFLSIPVFLMFTTIVFNDSEEASKSVTDLMAKVVGSLKYTLNFRERKTLWTVVHKLKKLSHEGLEKGLVIFSEDDLKKCELNTKDIRDLLLKVPRRRSLSPRLLEGDNLFFFCHQIFQEFFSACAIVEMNLSEFSNFVEAKLNEDNWTVVRRFVCGLIFAVSPNEEMLQIPDREEKQRILRENLIVQLAVARENQLLEVYAAIYETDDDPLILSVTEICLLFVGREAAHLIGLFLARSSTLDLLKLIESRSTDEMLDIMNIYLKGKRIEITNIDVSMMSLENFTFAAFNKFLRNITSHEICIRHGAISTELEGPDWKNIHRLKIKDILSYSRVVVRNNNADSDTIEILLESESVDVPPELFGSFTKKDKILNIAVNAGSPECCFSVFRVEMASHYLKPNSVLFNIAKKSPAQYVRHNQLGSIIQWDTSTKIDEIILDFLKPYNPDYPDVTSERLPHCEEEISSLVRQFEVKVFNVVVDMTNVGNIPKLLRHRLTQLDCEMKIHVAGMILHEDSLQELFQELQNHEDFSLEYLQLLVEWQIPTDQLIFFIECSIVTKQLCLYFSSGRATISDADKLKLHQAAMSSGISLKMEDWERSRGDDPWSRLWFRPSTRLRVDHRP